MSKLTPSGNNWVGTTTQNTKSKSYTFNTDDKYVDKNIVFTVETKDSVLGSADGSVSASNATLSDNNTSGISVTGSGSINVTEAGWINTGNIPASSGKTKYLTGVTLPVSKQFTINDGINTWTWTTDASGNVTIV